MTLELHCSYSLVTRGKQVGVFSTSCQLIPSDCQISWVYMENICGYSWLTWTQTDGDWRRLMETDGDWWRLMETDRCLKLIFKANILYKSQSGQNLYLPKTFIWNIFRQFSLFLIVFQVSVTSSCFLSRCWNFTSSLDKLHFHQCCSFWSLLSCDQWKSSLPPQIKSPPALEGDDPFSLFSGWLLMWNISRKWI